MTSGARSKSPGQVTAPDSIRAWAKTAGSFNASKTPVKWLGSNLTWPVVPSAKCTCNTVSRKTWIAITSHFTVTACVEVCIKVEGRFAMVAAFSCTVASPQAVQLDEVLPSPTPASRHAGQFSSGDYDACNVCLWCCRKNASMARDAEGPCGSVYEPAAWPPDQAWLPLPMLQCSI